MKRLYNGYILSNDRSEIQAEQIKKLMEQTYWAADRPEKIILKAIENSMCYGIYDENHLQVGFARVITDYATTYYICDVIIDRNHRKLGLGKELLRMITENEDLKGLRGILITSDAHGLYEKYGFKKCGEKFMQKEREPYNE